MVKLIRSGLVLLLGLAALSTATAAAAREPRFYMIVFGYGAEGEPEDSHSFATFYIQTDRGREGVRTISWLPCDDEPIPSLRATSGCNYSLEESLARRGDQPMSYWGPIEIDERFYQLARARVDWVLIDNGPIQFKLVDESGTGSSQKRDLAITGAGGWSNCIHAISDLLGYAPHELANGVKRDRRWGENASQMLVLTLAAAWRFAVPPEMRLMPGQEFRLRW